MISSAPRIRKLPPHLVNQIAAGEVIERPASVVKELIENALDAAAVHITVELAEGGKRLIQVSDDGLGISTDDLPLALSSHATSKLRESGDLQEIHTLGFRGEALASIASVSELDLQSRTPGREVGRRIEARDGHIRDGGPVSMPPGTRVRVRNLFYNIPARKRFLRTDRAELARVRAIVERLGLAHPHVGFHLTEGERTLLRYASGQSGDSRLKEVLGEERAARLVPLPADHPSLRGWVGRPDDARRDTNSIWTFLNGRFVRDRVILHALKECYKGFQIPGHHPVAVLLLDLDPQAVDLNVHPAKLEVRFRDSSGIHSLVYGVVRKALEELRSVPRLFPDPAPAAYRTSSAPGEGESVAEPWEASRRPHASTADARLPLSEPAAPLSTPVPPADGGRAFQVKNAYLVVEERDGLTVIDQHALHEKILYEEISERREAAARGGEGEGRFRQRLLCPETVELSAEEWEVFVRADATLVELGFEVEEFGDRSVVVRSLPAGFEDAPVVELLRTILRRLRDALEHGTGVELRERIVATLACKGAVKAGQPLSPPAIEDLLAGRKRAFQPQNCPHGRPTELFISWRELERRFDRK